MKTHFTDCLCSAFVWLFEAFCVMLGDAVVSRFGSFQLSRIHLTDQLFPVLLHISGHGKENVIRVF